MRALTVAREVLCVLPRRHSWRYIALHLGEGAADLYALHLGCACCEVQRLVLFSSGRCCGESYRVPGRTGWAALEYARPSCPPSDQDLLNMERLGHGH